MAPARVLGEEEVPILGEGLEGDVGERFTGGSGHWGSTLVCRWGDPTMSL